jgi:hypothetical protein
MTRRYAPNSWLRVASQNNNLSFLRTIFKTPSEEFLSEGVFCTFSGKYRR